MRDFSDSAGAGLGGAGRKETSLFWFVSTVTLLCVSCASLSCLPSLFEFLLCVFPCCLCEGYVLKWVGIPVFWFSHSEEETVREEEKL